ncbi:MAG: hypothetical protein DI533_06025 [Cereibacter sphaeroides]|uniref:Aminoglycoside phosphotransferase domain-containing protein n=1 Tax=Cereibacter sphaeroides TaxID=1063 RepID=A0A2W5TVM4_CERSP|nr:MAG: hypothetical protein DI533_06025 [Cereibacter sphaeroides]
MLTWHIPFDPRHEKAIVDFAATTGPRAGSYEIDGQRFWIKRIEKQRWINRIQKGPAPKAFAADLAALKFLAGRGVPVPQIVAEDKGLFAMRDSGPTLQVILRDRLGTEAERVAAFAAAGKALAELHGMGISHGRPVPGDICYQDGRITFLDFENYRAHRNRPKDFRLDLIIFIFMIYSFRRDESPEIIAAKAAYRANDPGGIWDSATEWLRGLRWVDTLTKPLQWRADPHAREFKSIPVTLRAFGV